MKLDVARHRHRHLPIVAPLLFIGASGCASIIGADFDPAHLESKSRDASVDRSRAPEASACNPLVPPERPSQPVTSTDEIDFTVVVQTIDFGEAAQDGGVPGWFTTGYDIDGLCTTRTGPTPCAPYPWLGNVIHEDGPRGQDNAVALLIHDEQDTFGIRAVGTRGTNKGVSEGSDAPIGVIRVRAFGGLSEDDHVEVDWFVAAKLGATGDGGGDAGVAPRFDATDHWPLASTSLVDPTVTDPASAVSKHRDGEAFVTKTALVAHFSHIEIPLSNVYFELSNVTLTGEVRRTPNRIWKLDNVVVSGVTTAKSLLGVVPEIAYVSFGVPLCTDTKGNYPKVKRFLCGSADLPQSLGDPPTSFCSAASVGMRIETAPASLGPIVTLPPLPNPCSPETDPHNDSCDVPPSSD